MSIYVAGLVFKWILKEGGLTVMEERCQKKSDAVYKVIDESGGFYRPLIEKGSRSRVNVVFAINPESLHSQFVKEGEARDLYGLAGHRLLGGIRVSLYNAVTIAETELLVKFMKEFQEKYSK